MDEVRWQATRDLAAMLEFLGPGASPRKLRLFAAACARHVEENRWLFDARGFAAVAIAELFADGLATAQDMERAYNLARSRHVGPAGHPWELRDGVREAACTAAWDAARALSGLVIDVVSERSGWLRASAGRAEVRNVL